MRVQILFRDTDSCCYNHNQNQITVTNNEDEISNTPFDYILVCATNVCVHVENLFSYLQEEERSNRISPTTDVAIVNSDDQTTFILTQKSSQNMSGFLENSIIQNLRTRGTGIVYIESRLSKTHPQLNTIVLCDQTKREQMIRDLENEKEAKHAKIQRIRSLLLQKP
jgi:hypothetical protein